MKFESLNDVPSIRASTLTQKLQPLEYVLSYPFVSVDVERSNKAIEIRGRLEPPHPDVR